jgi:hypothetical protein
MEPFEVVCSPYTVWVGPVGTPMPAIDAAEGAFDADWTKLGKSGNKNYEDEGVTVTHSQTVNTFTGAGGTAPRKAWRTDEGLMVALALADLSPEQYALALDDAAITTVAAGVGTPGEKRFEVLRGVEVAAFAVLVRGISPVDEALNAQYEIASCYQGADPAPKFSKQGPAVLALEYHVLEATAGVFATLRIGTAPATS